MWHLINIANAYTSLVMTHWPTLQSEARLILLVVNTSAALLEGRRLRSCVPSIGQPGHHMMYETMHETSHPASGSH